MQRASPRIIRILAAVVIALLLLGFYAWFELRQTGYGEAFVSGNGRIEATEIDIATKLGGRIESITVKEGDFVKPGQLLVQMDTTTLQAQLNQAQAQQQQAENAIATAVSQVRQRESQKTAGEALVTQREAEVNAVSKRYERVRVLVERNAMSRQSLDDALATLQSARAALAAAQAQVHAEEAGIAAAQSQVFGAQSAMAAAGAASNRVSAEITDSQLLADRVARVQFRTAEPGEVLAAGGRVVNLVDLADVYMTFFLPEREAGRVAMGADVRLILDAVPQYVIPAKVSYVASVAQFTPKTVETESEREKMMFRVKARIDPALLREHMEQVKTGLPGIAWLKLDADAPWPDELAVNVPQ
ncbi:HlyD family efflux transporter periplasmic adaptor subunit [Pseudomonas neustonica]|uniref:HlyD family efflux transporter periplasmic adaptor subunit n=1 Tax=Pseudomonas neustonica TaxID=2487346 RepID=A0ABX9XEW8_9PSED|nr:MULTISPECIES: HlyD family efflux transporter periplasmic adaptor subunit [Pseudomonas]MAB25777.1 glycoside hydrolase family 43 [Pseudomonadales bacterium]ROZ81041.1 HlyD family efflux transporter periplasmic adaptor subunit [Pseudomonas sp. SSM44]ROZ82283.1 HlyD family efflux transporter periplasmic adaptor subunit [Pseudomonas neustonica]|tara:strand:+ start:11881 stop:12957 length:1077 start_codon:yes stop_codon:yes gene_type:complete